MYKVELSNYLKTTLVIPKGSGCYLGIVTMVNRTTGWEIPLSPPFERGI